MTVKRSELEEVIRRSEQASFNYWNNHIDSHLKYAADKQHTLEFSSPLGVTIKGFELTRSVAFMLATEYHRHGWSCIIAPDPDPRDHYDVLTIKVPA